MDFKNSNEGFWPYESFDFIFADKEQPEFGLVSSPFVKALAEKHARTEFMFFTKNTKELNDFLDTNEFPKNVHIIVSRWIDDNIENKHNLPESHVLFTKLTHEGVDAFIASGEKPLKVLGATSCTSEKPMELCGGNCSACFVEGKGCWFAKKGTDIILPAH